MIRDGQEVQWPYQLHGLAGIGNHLVPPRQPKSGVRVQRGSDQPRVERDVSVRVHVAEKHLVGVGPPGVRRVDLLLGDIVLGNVVLGFLRRRITGT